jgi:hypothetical protein
MFAVQFIKQHVAGQEQPLPHATDPIYTQSDWLLQFLRQFVLRCHCRQLLLRLISF